MPGDVCDCCGATDGRPLPHCYSGPPDGAFHAFCDPCAEEMRAVVEAWGAAVCPACRGAGVLDGVPCDCATVIGLDGPDGIAVMPGEDPWAG